MELRLLEERSRILTETRAFFLELGYLETDTPALAPALIPESCLEVFKTEYDNPFLGRKDLWLVPSPEVWMKPLIARYRRSVFQICKCFRNSESIGRIHNPEFTMLEYYTVEADSGASMELTEELFRRCAGPETPSWARPPFRRLTMADAFHDLAGLDLEALQDRETLIEAGRGKDLMISAQASWEDAFNQIFLTLVEPRLPAETPLALERYPAQIECLAKNIPGTPWKDRWELYVGGMELCNCYTEASDSESVRASFTREADRKRVSRVPHRVDFSYPDIFEDFPPCSGVALGFDRFILALTGSRDMGQLLPYPFERILNAEEGTLYSL